MKYEIIDIISSYNEKKITSVQAMDSISSLFTPDELHKDADEYIARLIAFMFDVHPDNLFNSDTVREGDNTVFRAKSMLSKVLHIKWKNTEGKEKLSAFTTKLGLSSVQSLYYRLEQHNIFYKMDTEYRYIYDIVKKILL